MQVGPAEILIILVVALLVFGPQRLPEVGRQVGAAMREFRKMQDSVRGEIDMVLHPEHGTRNADDAVEPGDHTANVDDIPMPEIEAGGAPPSTNGAGTSEIDGGFLGPPDSFI